MNLEQRISAFVELGKKLEQLKNDNNLLKNIEAANPWFIKENVVFSIESIRELLTKENLENWISKYPKLQKSENKNKKTIAVVTAGNIPLVGFHDFLSVLISGNKILLKLSGKDNILLKKIAELLINIDKDFEKNILFTEQILKNFDAIITTGSDNSAKHFSYYFDKYPHIIRKNRNSIAILDGNETNIDLENLSNDIFMYFGLGCRNVSKIYIPENYNIDRIFESFLKYKNILNHNKYANNYDYNRSIYLMNNIKFLENGFVILKEDTGFSSPISVVYYEYYQNQDKLIDNLSFYKDKIQIIVSNISEKFVKFGKAQKPGLFDYADNVDTLNFLTGL